MMQLNKPQVFGKGMVKVKDHLPKDLKHDAMCMAIKIAMGLDCKRWLDRNKTTTSSFA